MSYRNCAFLIPLFVFFTSSLANAQTIRSAAGADAAAVQVSLDTFRNDLGVNNAVGPCAGACVPGVGRREINWDGVPDNLSSGGSPFPGDFFDQATGSPAGRIRGSRFTTTGSFEVSADSDSDGDGNPGPVATLFGNHSPDNAADFGAFSPERIFGIVGHNEMDITFSVPGSPGSPALVKGFGAIFTDVEVNGSTKLDFFDSNNNLLHSGTVPHFEPVGGESGKSFSFLGVSFDTPRVARVHVTNGGFDLNLQQFGSNDAVAMDDFVYGEPVAIPEPTTVWPIVLGACILRSIRRSSSRKCS